MPSINYAECVASPPEFAVLCWDISGKCGSKIWKKFASLQLALLHFAHHVNECSMYETVRDCNPSGCLVWRLLGGVSTVMAPTPLPSMEPPATASHLPPLPPPATPASPSPLPPLPPPATPQLASHLPPLPPPAIPASPSPLPPLPPPTISASPSPLPPLPPPATPQLASHLPPLPPPAAPPPPSPLPADHVASDSNAVIAQFLKDGAPYLLGAPLSHLLQSLGAVSDYHMLAKQPNCRHQTPLIDTPPRLSLHRGLDLQ